MKTALLVTVILGIGLIAVLFLAEPAFLKGQDIMVSGSDKDLNYQISKLQADVQRLEAKIADLQNQIRNMEYNPRVVTIPGSQLPQGTQVPPGSKQHEVGGVKFWTIPLQQ